MPGTVLRVLVAPGDRVEARQPLIVLEAMKMETPLRAPYAGEVAAVHVSEGDTVEAGARAARARLTAQKSFCSFIAAPMSPSTLILPVM